MVHSSIIMVENVPNVEVKIAGSNKDEFAYIIGRVLKFIEVAEVYGGILAPIEPEKLRGIISVSCTITFKNDENRGKFLTIVPFI